MRISVLVRSREARSTIMRIYVISSTSRPGAQIASLRSGARLTPPTARRLASAVRRLDSIAVFEWREVIPPNVGTHRRGVATALVNASGPERHTRSSAKRRAAAPLPYDDDRPL